MFLKRQQFMKKKIIGGSLLGNLFDRVKNTLFNTSKILLPKAKTIGKMTAQKALQATKEQITPEKVFDVVQDIVKKDKTSVKKKLKSHGTKIVQKVANDKELHPEMRDVLNSLSQNQNVKQVLERKAKELLNKNSRAILSNLVAGSGLKKL